jgi:hypothetical protein
MKAWILKANLDAIVILSAATAGSGLAGKDLI